MKCPHNPLHEGDWVASEQSPPLQRYHFPLSKTLIPISETLVINAEILTPGWLVFCHLYLRAAPQLLHNTCLSGPLSTAAIQLENTISSFFCMTSFTCAASASGTCTEERSMSCPSSTRRTTVGLACFWSLLLPSPPTTQHRGDGAETPFLGSPMAGCCAEGLPSHGCAPPGSIGAQSRWHSLMVMGHCFPADSASRLHGFSAGVADCSPFPGLSLEHRPLWDSFLLRFPGTWCLIKPFVVALWGPYTAELSAGQLYGMWILL